MASLRLNGAALACFVQSGLKAICGTLRLVGPFGGDQFGALWRAAVDQHHVGMLGVNLVEMSQIRRWSLKSRPPVSAIFGPAGTMTSVSARRLAAMKSRDVDHCRGERAVIDK